MNKFLLLYLLFTTPFIMGWFINHTQYDRMDETYEWSDMSAFTHPQKDVCIGTGNGIDFNVDVIFEPNMEPLGRWENDTRTIKLREVDIDTVAHEVNHLVKDLVKQYGITDPHYEAYAQGFWTKCVWDIVQRKEVIDGINRLNGTQ